MPTRDCYTILGIKSDANLEEIRKAYLKQAVKWHPDRNRGSSEAEEKFKEVSAAYEILSDPEKRKAYDRYGQVGSHSAAPAPPKPTNSSSYRRRDAWSKNRRDNFPRHQSQPIFNLFDQDEDDFFFPFAAHFGFHFTSPEQVFRDFFAQQMRVINSLRPMYDVPSNRTTPSQRTFTRLGSETASDGGSNNNVATTHRRHHPRSHTTNIIIMSSTTNNSPSNQRQRRSSHTVRSTSTSFVNGKKVTTRQTIVNGVETLEVEENGVLKQRTINGKPVAIKSGGY